MLDDTLRTELKDLFGRPQRVVLACWIVTRDREPFFLREAADGIRALVGDSGLTYELSKFVDAGMLAVHPDGRRNYYTRMEHGYWSAYEAICRTSGIDNMLASAAAQQGQVR